MFNSYISFPHSDLVVLNNTVVDYAVAAVIFVVLLIVLTIVYKVVLHRLKAFSARTNTDIDDAIIRIVDNINPPFYAFIAFYIAVRFLTLNAFVEEALTALLLVFLVAQTVKAVRIVIVYITAKKAGRDVTGEVVPAAQLLTLFATIVLWVFGGVLILSNLGIDVTSLIAGLGIGGVAVALALQNILGDLFSSFAIYFDKPFVVGDFIAVGDKTGVVQKIGIKTTRLLALQGEELIFSNKELTSAQIQNFKKLQERREVFEVGVAYDTSDEKLRAIPLIIKNVVTGIKHVRFDRAHLKQFGDSALMFEIVYYAETAVYSEYMDTLQDIHLGIKKSFDEKEIEIAFPTRTLYIKKD